MMNAFQWALVKFCEAWQAHYGYPYRPTAADRNQLGRTLRELSREDLGELPTLFARYLLDLNTFLTDKRHPLRFFCTDGGVNKYRVEPVVMSAREARGVQAARQFVAEGCDAKNGRGR